MTGSRDWRREPRPSFTAPPDQARGRVRPRSMDSPSLSGGLSLQHQALIFTSLSHDVAARTLYPTGSALPQCHDANHCLAVRRFGGEPRSCDATAFGLNRRGPETRSLNRRNAVTNWGREGRPSLGHRLLFAASIRLESPGVTAKGFRWSDPGAL
jgi:hypothetical protein